MANTVFKAENGLLVIGSANVTGALTVGGEFNISGNITFSGLSNGDFIPINNNYSLGNTSNLWNARVANVFVYNTATINVANFSGVSTFSSNVFPSTNNVNLGDTTRRWDFYANNANVTTLGAVTSIATPTLTVSSSAVVNGTFTVNPGSGNTILATGTTLTLGGTLSTFAGNSNFDSGVLFVDATNNRTGVNNTTPDAALTVTGAANVSGAMVIGGAATIGGAVTIAGNLTVSGTTTYVNTATLSIADNIVQLNADVTGAPSENAGIEVVRGTSANVSIRWNETLDRWESTNDGALFYRIVDNNLFATTDISGVVVLLDSVSNTATANYAATPNSVRLAYNLAGNAVSNAISYAATAYSNATTYAASIAATAYSNAVSQASASAGVAYSNAISYAASVASTAYSNGTTYAATIASTAYSNAASYADTKAATAFANAISIASADATSKAATAYSNGTIYAASIAATAFSNATSYAATVAATAFANGVAYTNSVVPSTGTNLQINSLGVGTAASGTSGMIRCTNDITAFYSDSRLKTVVGHLENSLDKVRSLDSILFVNNETAKKYGFDDDKQRVGLVAQQVQVALPEAVAPAPFDTDEHGNSISGENYLTVQYEKIVPLLVAAIKDLEKQVHELKAQHGSKS